MDAEFVKLIHPGHSAVLVIDIQNDSCHPEGVYAKIGWDISLRQRSGHRAAEFVKEVRKYNVPVIFTKFNQSSWNVSPAWIRHSKVLGHRACMEGTWGEEFYATEPLAGDLVVVKHRYSAFIGTDLDVTLRSREMTTLILTGGGTNVCVEATAMDGFQLGYDIVVASDCCGTPDVDEHAPALKRMARLCATVVESKEVLEAWSPAEVERALP
jgi:ureidoacrylate peracid hydrolase